MNHLAWCQTMRYGRESYCDCLRAREEMESTPKLDKTLSTPPPWDDGPGSMKVTVHFTNGEANIFDHILVPTQGEAIGIHDGEVRFESDDLNAGKVICYSIPVANVLWWETQAR